MRQRHKLAGIAEVAEILDVTKQTIADRRRHGTKHRVHPGPAFPEPIAELACGPIFDTDEVRAYKRRYNREVFPAQKVRRLEEREHAAATRRRRRPTA